MKRFTFILLLLFSSVSFSFSQIVKQDTTKREYKNVVGLDATGIFRQVFNSGGAPYVYSPYIISYRRIMKSNAIRVLLGGNVSNNDNTMNDSMSNKSSSTNFNVAIGFEHYRYLGKRWNYYYGLDLLVKYSVDHNESLNPKYNTRQTNTRNGYGISPLIGLQFRINSRLSVSTEASYDIIYTTINTTSTISSSPISSKYKRTSVNANFNAPLSINFRIQF